jgi:hypothetical protein
VTLVVLWLPTGRHVIAEPGHVRQLLAAGYQPETYLPHDVPGAPADVDVPGMGPMRLFVYDREEAQRRREADLRQRRGTTQSGLPRVEPRDMGEVMYGVGRSGGLHDADFGGGRGARFVGTIDLKAEAVAKIRRLR